MCGIVGFNWEDGQKVRSLASLLQHRGPEQEGFHVADGVSIGHKRLCILDLTEKGRQPLYNEDQSICVSCNGEIYNFCNLRQDLEKKGHHFMSNTDTEVLVHGYEQWDTDVLQAINGQFAFCIFDSKKNLFFLARDRLGIKPLYYYSESGKFIFGSELKVFLKSDIKREINREAMDFYVLYGTCPSGQTILNRVQKLPPRTYLIYDLNTKKIQKHQRYWELTFSEDTYDSQTEMTREIKQRLDQSVRRRLVSDVPLGAFLSGGLDSSIIVSLMRKHVKELKTFSIKFDYPDFNESQYAKIISDKFNTKHFEIAFNAEDVINLMSQLAYYYDEPFGDPSMIPTYLVSTVAKKEVTVSLSGTGGDELFGGYPRYLRLMLLKKINQMPLLLKRIIDYSIDLASPILRTDRLSQLQPYLGPKDPVYLIYLKLLSYMLRTKADPAVKLQQFSYLEKYFKYENDLTNALNFDLNQYLPNDLLVKEDRASMAVSLEARVPFLDHEFVEFAARIPAYMKIRRGEKKFILKKAFEDTLPRAIVYRKKQGFGVPLIHYFRNELREVAHDLLFNFKEYDYYDKTHLKVLWHRHQKKLADYSRIFWTIIMFNVWYKKWMT